MAEGCSLPVQSIRLSDEELILCLKAGYQEALTIFFERYYRLVLSIATKVVRDAAEAEDVLQEVFLAVYQQAAQFDPKRANAKVWLLQIAYHRSLSRRRRLAARSFYCWPSQSEFQESQPDPSTWSSLSAVEAKRLVNEALQTLTDKERRTIELAYFEGLSMKEIADRTGDSFVAVRHQYYRAMKKLHALLWEPGGERALVPRQQEIVDAGA